MYRVFFENGQQQNFLQSVYTAGYSWDSIASICGVCTRTIRDWRREKFKMSYEAAVKLSEISGVAMPTLVEVRPEYWSTVKAGRTGAIARDKIYGNLGTPEGLMDTDGGVYLHKYKVNGKPYQYIKMCYTSHSKPLLYAVEKKNSEAFQF